MTLVQNDDTPSGLDQTLSEVRFSNVPLQYDINRTYVNQYGQMTINHVVFLMN